MPTKADYLDLVARRPGPARVIEPSLLRAAAIQSEQLTGLPEWDSYLTKLQPLLDQARQEKAALLEMMGRSFIDSELRAAQCHYHASAARVETLEMVMELPKIIIEAHREHRS